MIRVGNWVALFFFFFTMVKYTLKDLPFNHFKVTIQWY